MYLSTVNPDDAHVRLAAGRMEHNGRNETSVGVQYCAAVGALVTTFDQSHENLPLLHVTGPTRRLPGAGGRPGTRTGVT
jgi:hypothetical protein